MGVLPPRAKLSPWAKSERGIVPIPRSLFAVSTDVVTFSNRMRVILMNSSGKRIHAILMISACALALCASACGRDTGEEPPEETTPPTVIIFDDMGEDTGGRDMGSGDDMDVPDEPDMGEDPDQGPDVPDPVGCEGFELETSGTLDLNMNRVVVQGTLTLDGEPFPAPDDGFGAGSLLFTREDGLASATLALDGETQTYEVGLTPGVYHIDYIGDPAACSKPDEPSTLPCNTGRLLEAITLTQSGILDLDIPTVTIQGTLSLNGEALPGFDDSSVGLAFSNGMGSVQHNLDVERGGRYGITLVPGTYRIGWNGDETRCATHEDASPLPCNDGVVVAEQELRQSGSLDLGLESVRVNGRVTLNGETIDEDDPTAAAMLAWTSSSSPVPVVTKIYEPGEQAVYALHLLKGNYTVSWQGDPAYCQDLDADEMLPCHTGIIGRDVALGVSGTLDFDLETVRIYGAMTLAGENPSDEHEGSRGTVLLSDQDGQIVTLPFTRDGERLQYIANVLEGTYRSVWSGNPGLCADLEIDHDFPCNAGVFGEARALNTGGELSFDVPLVRLTGRITLAGEALPVEEDARGQLTFVHKSHTAVSSAMLSKDEPANYRVVLLPGVYDIVWTPNPALCNRDIAEPTSVPCTSGMPLTEQRLERDGSLPVDLSAITIAGTFTQDGNALPEPDFSGRGNLLFHNLDAGGPWALPAFDATGEARYRVTIYPGPYVFSHQADPSHCVHGSDDQQSIACGYKVFRGCE